MDPHVYPSADPHDFLSEKMKERHLEFLELFTQHKHKVENECDILTSLYLEKIGQFQLEWLKKKTELSALKMKLKLIQAAINRDEKPNMSAIEDEIDSRLKNYYKQIQAQTAALEQAKKVLSQLLSTEESQKLKELFRVLCKKLHPDLNPFQSEEEKDLFIKVKAAYDLKLISELQKIYIYLEDSSPKKMQLWTTPEKEAHLKHLEQQIADLKNKIEQLDSRFPFTMKALLMDETLVRAQQEELQHHINTAQEDIAKYSKIIHIIIDDRSV